MAARRGFSQIILLVIVFVIVFLVLAFGFKKFNPKTSLNIPGKTTASDKFPPGNSDKVLDESLGSVDGDLKALDEETKNIDMSLNDVQIDINQ